MELRREENVGRTRAVVGSAAGSDERVGLRHVAVAAATLGIVLGVSVVATGSAVNGGPRVAEAAQPSPNCAPGVGDAGLSAIVQAGTEGGDGCVVIEYLSGGATFFETFDYSGVTESWTVPTGVTAVRITAHGAGGGGTNIGPVRTKTDNTASWYSGNTDEGAVPVGRDGGAGGSASAVFAVTPGESLSVLVGQGGVGNPDSRCLPTQTRDTSNPPNDLPARNTDLNEARASVGGGGRAKSHYNTRTFRDFPLSQDFPDRDDDECINPYFASGGGRSEVRRGTTRLVVAGGGGGAGFLGRGGAGATVHAGDPGAVGSDGEGPPSCCNHSGGATVSPTFGSGGTTSVGGTGGLTSRPTDLYTRTHWNGAVFFPGYELPRVNGLAGGSLLGGASLEGGGGGGGGCFGGGGGGDGGGGGGGSSCVHSSQISPPVAVDDQSSGAFDVDQVIDVLANDSSTSPVDLAPSSVRLCASESETDYSVCSSTSLTVAGEGVYSVNQDGTVTFNPEGSFVGQASPVRYVVADSAGQLVSATITPTVSEPAAPGAASEQRPVLPGRSVDFTSLTGPEGLATSPAGFDPTLTCIVEPGTTTCSATGVIDIVGEGRYVLDSASGVVTFTAESGAPVGPLTPIVFRVTDSFGRSVTATLTAVVPSPPVAVDDASSGAVDVDQVIDVVANDSATSPAILAPSSVRLCASESETDFSVCSSTSLTVTGEGVYSVGVDGVVTFDPEGSFVGQASPVRYVVADSVGQLASATITPTVSGPELEVGGVAPSPDGSELPRTGSEPLRLLLLGLSLAALGLVVLLGQVRDAWSQHRRR